MQIRRISQGKQERVLNSNLQSCYIHKKPGEICQWEKASQLSICKPPLPAGFLQGCQILPSLQLETLIERCPWPPEGWPQAGGGERALPQPPAFGLSFPTCLFSTSLGWAFLDFLCSWTLPPGLRPGAGRRGSDRGTKSGSPGKKGPSWPVAIRHKFYKEKSIPLRQCWHSRETHL